MTCYVTGIAATSDVSQLETLLGGMSGVDRSKLSVITLSDETEEHESSFLNFIHAGGAYIDTDVQGSLAGTDTAIITGSGGTGVPQMDTSSTRLGYLSASHIAHHLGALPIPEDEVGNYNDALDNGSAVIAYDCIGGDFAVAEAAFRSAGVKHVKVFTS
ncbi:MAG: hypothetical protein M3N13_08750 [Candidatus Eremiobacteraeota bacterium]|nr:hypothetical protein [Candidatus Eremiobacteraeota bacterium]